MLILSRRVGENIRIGDNTVLTVAYIGRDTVRLRVGSPLQLKLLSVHALTDIPAIIDPQRVILLIGNDQALQIGADIRVQAVSVRGAQLQLGIAAPRHVQVHREEVFERIQRGEATSFSRRVAHV
ncbi:MAG: hypothetical protein EPN79_16180 [Burkholderiaceae bacterium]|nr:MAG: hypothetical protein EPN79_16180 [Burkholderiaceae bacterium]